MEKKVDCNMRDIYYNNNKHNMIEDKDIFYWCNKRNININNSKNMLNYKEKINE